MDGFTREKLEGKYASGEASTRLWELTQGPITVSNVEEIKAEILILSEHGVSPTLNICRHWTAVVTTVDLNAGRLADWANKFALVANRDDPAPTAEDREEFDIESVLMWRVVPTIEDEETMDDWKKTDDTERVAATLEQEVTRAYDNSTRGFSEWFKKAWASDAVFKALRTNIPDAIKIMQAWLDRSAMSLESDEAVGEMTLQLSSDVDKFATAYIAAAGETAFTPLTHAAFTDVFFQQKRSKQNIFFKLLATAVRKHVTWKDREIMLIATAPKELEHFDMITKVTAYLAPSSDLEDSDLHEVMEKLPSIVKQCRAKSQDQFLEALREHCVARSEQMIDPSATQLDNTYRADCMGSLKDHLAYFDPPRGEAAAQEYANLKIRLADTHASVQATVSIELIADLATTTEVEKLGSDDLFSVFNFVSREDVVSLEESLATLATNCIAALGDATESMRNASSSDLPRIKGTVDSLLTNAKLVISKITSPPISEDNLVEIHLNALGVFAAGVKHKDLKTKGSFSAMTAAMKQWWTTTKVPQDCPVHKAFARSCLALNTTCMMEYKVEHAGKLQIAQNLFLKVVVDSEKLANGLASGESWKEEIQDDWDLQKILKHADTPTTGLLHGPGNNVKSMKAEL